MNAPVPSPAPKRKWEHRGGTCPKHGNACAMRRCRLTLGPWECVECAHEAGTLQALPPASPPAAAPPPPTEQQTPSQTEAVEGQGVVCTPTVNRSLLEARAETEVVCFTVERAEERERAAIDAEQLLLVGHKACVALFKGRLTYDDLGIELLRISNALATESKRLRLQSAPPPVVAAAQLSTPQPADAPVPESAAESQSPGGGADADLPPGWRRDREYIEYETGAFVFESKERPQTWAFSAPGNLHGDAPTMLQAMCAALGIRYAQDAISGNYYATLPGSPDLVRDEQRIKSWKACCRAALERHHARQQLASNAIPECLCTWEDDEITAYHARCVVHASEHDRQRPAEPQCPVLRAFEADGIVERATHARQQPAPATTLADACPPGWSPTDDGLGKGTVAYVHDSGARVWPLSDAAWRWSRPEMLGYGDTLPSRAQAMCAALGLVVEHHDGDDVTGPYTTARWPDGTTSLGVGDSLCRSVLERFHARQQPAPECKCWHANMSGHRIVNRRCALHGASWQTLAEQSAELHDDGTPRAGCAVCSSPELDARERGLR